MASFSTFLQSKTLPNDLGSTRLSKLQSLLTSVSSAEIRDSWRQIAITLTDPEKGERKAHACAIAC